MLRTSFYTQSAFESAQLLLVTALGAVAGTLRVHALADLGWPVSLLDVALGVLMETRSSAPIHFSGYEQGYESMPFPGLYDPATAGEVSPLISAFEAPLVTPCPVAAVDAFSLALTPNPGRDELLDKLEETCDTTKGPAAIRAALDALSLSLLEGTLSSVPRDTLRRAARATAPYRGNLTAEQRRLLASIENLAVED